MLKELRPAIVSFLLLTVITGVIYPAVVTLIAKAAFPVQAGGSVVERDGRAIGSALIAQSFSDAKYFWTRPSPANYDATAGSGSNLGPNNPALVDAVSARIKTLRPAQPLAGIPADLVTASASGLDPHISPAAAELQVARVAQARRMSEEAVRHAVAACTEGRTLGVLGEPRVNVLRLNLALDHGLEQGHVAMLSGRTFGSRGTAFLPW